LLTLGGTLAENLKFEISIGFDEQNAHELAQLLQVKYTVDVSEELVT